MIKKLIYLPERMDAQIRQEADDLQLSFAETLRRIVDKHFEGQEEQ